MFVIVDDESGKHATNGAINIALLPDGESNMFHRRALRKHMATGETEQLDCLVAELNGVRIYVRSDELFTNIVMTTRDINL